MCKITKEKHLDVSLIASEKLSILDLHVTTESITIIFINIVLNLEGNSTYIEAISKIYHNRSGVI